MILRYCIKFGRATVKGGHTLWVVDVTLENFFGPRWSIQRIYSVLWNLNIRHESLCSEMCYHFPPMKKHTNEHEERLSEMHIHLHWWHFNINKTLFLWLWIKLLVSGIPGSITVDNEWPFGP